MHLATHMGAKYQPLYAPDTEGAGGDEGESIDFAANAILNQFKDADDSQPSETDEGKKKHSKHSLEPNETEESEEEEEEELEIEEGDDEDEEEDDDSEEEEREKPKSKRVVLDHDAEAFVKIKVDGKETEVKVGDLARLHGQEASLTRKSTEVADMRKGVEAEHTKYVAATAQLLERAQARAAPYAKVDWVSLTKDPTVSAEELKAFHKEAMDAQSDVAFLEQSLNGAVQDLHQARHTQLVAQGAEAWKVLSDPDTGIKGWGTELHNNVLKFAAENGMNTEVLKNLVDPAAIKLLHKAFLYEKGSKATTTKVNKTPKKIIKESSETSVSPVRRETSVKAAEVRARKSGTLDDAVELLMRRNKAASDDD